MKPKTSDQSVYIGKDHNDMLNKIAVKMANDAGTPTSKSNAARIIIESLYTKWFPPPPDNAI